MSVGYKCDRCRQMFQGSVPEVPAVQFSPWSRVTLRSDRLCEDFCPECLLWVLEDAVKSLKELGAAASPDCVEEEGE